MYFLFESLFCLSATLFFSIVFSFFIFCSFFFFFARFVLAILMFLVLNNTQIKFVLAC